MIYSNHRAGYIRHVREKKDGPPPAAGKRNGKDTHREGAQVDRQSGRYYGTSRRERVVSRGGKLAIVTD